MKFVIGLSLAIALGEFVLAVVFPPLVAYPFFALQTLFGGGSPSGNGTLLASILAILSMTVGPALLITWLKQPSRVEQAREQAREVRERKAQDRMEARMGRMEARW